MVPRRRLRAGQTDGRWKMEEGVFFRLLLFYPMLDLRDEIEQTLKPDFNVSVNRSII